MVPDHIRRLLKHVPFAPFTLELSSGSRVRVAHPDYALLSPGGDTMFVYTDPEGKNMEWINVYQVTNLSVEGGSETLAEQGR
jgi:hypothetical protein